MLDSKKFGTKVAALRKEKGLTQNQLAEKLNISNKAVSRWETGEGFPEISLLASLADALGVTVDFLLKEEITDITKVAEITDITEAAEIAESQEFSAEECGNAQCDDKANTCEPNEPKLSIIKQLAWKNLNGFNKFAFLTTVSAIAALMLYAVFVFVVTTFDVLPSEQSVTVITISVAPFTLLPRAGFVSALIGLILGLFEKTKPQTKISILLILSNLFVTYGLPILLYIAIAVPQNM